MNICQGTEEPHLTAIQLSHFVITAILFWPGQKLSQLFSYFKSHFNTVIL